MSRNPFLELIQPAPDIPGTFWATVVGTSPLRVQRDSEPVLAVTPKTVTRLTAGDRVLCLWENRQVVVLGVLGGPPSEDVITINGVDYARTGQMAIPSFTLTNYGGPDGNVYGGTVSMPVPYTPPSGWTFDWSISDTSGFTVMSIANRAVQSGRQNCRISQIGSESTTAAKWATWQLVRWN